jgi:hypothetical protein
MLQHPDSVAVRKMNTSVRKYRQARLNQHGIPAFDSPGTEKRDH